MTRRLWLAAPLGAALWLACQAPPPCECVCDCKEAAAATTEESPAPDEAGSGAVLGSGWDTPPPRPTRRPGAVRDRRADRGKAARGKGARARGQVSARPGTGAVVPLDDQGRKEMQTVFSGFIKAAAKRDIPGMKRWTTGRWGDNLDGTIERYEKRFYRSVDQLVEALPSGMTLGEVRDTGGGNFEGQFRFGSGLERRPIFFKEGGKWRINRL